MCGICGFIDKKQVSKEIVMQMVQTIVHRGPDNQSVSVYPENFCVLGHARLSIIDLSEAANQPLEFSHYSIVFNGEVYNFREIRKDLEELGHSFKLDSDTEVILHAYAQWGKDCVKRFIGMFAFAILDKKRNILFLVRDRAGVKPLYYYNYHGVFLFASELKAFYPHPNFEKKLDKKGIALYFRYGYIPAPNAIFEHVFKLEAGCWLEYNITRQEYETNHYWDVFDYYRKPKLTVSYEEAKEQIKALLKSAFNYRMVADVPVGVFLSGGYDSVGVTAMLQKERTEKLKTFTIGFPVGNNEAPIAKEIASYLGTDHTEYICTHDDCKRIVPSLPKYFDEPFADNSAVPTILVSRLARQKVKVALSADAGDETFAGYDSYSSLQDVLGWVNKTRKIKGSFISSLVGRISSLLNPYSFLKEKAETLAILLNRESRYRTAIAFENGGSLMESVYHYILTPEYPQNRYLLDVNEFHDAISMAQAIDYVHYMQNDILTKVDRASMSCSLEGREPFLDQRIIEYVAQLPTEYKLSNGIRKRIFKDIVHEYVPKEMMDRPKTGFTMPINHWLKTDLKYLLEDNLNELELNPEWFNVSHVLNLKKLFYQNKLGHEEKVIWRILEFQLWKKYHV